MTTTIGRLFALGAVIATLTTAPAAAQETMTFDFDSEDLTGWEVAPESGVVDGVLRILPGGFAVLNGDWTDLQLDVQIRTEGPAETFVNYHLSDRGRHTLILLPDQLVLEGEGPDGPEMLGSAPHGGLSGWTDLRIAVSGTQHTISLDDEPLLDVTSSNIASGAIGFGVAGDSAAEFDNLTLAGTAAAAAPGDEGADVPTPTAVETTAPTTAASAATDDGGGWLDSFLSGQTQTSELGTFAGNLLLAALLSFVLGLVYVHWGTSLSNRRKFAANFMLITITTTFIILVVRSSVALSLGLVGALSIVRFRAAIKEPEELAYLFLAVGIGIGLGDNQRLVTILALAVAIVFIGVRRLFHGRESDVNMHLTVGGENRGEVALPALLDALKPHVRKMKLIRFDEAGSGFEASLLVEFREITDLHDAHAAVLALSPDLDITFLDNHTVGG